MSELAFASARRDLASRHAWRLLLTALVALDAVALVVALGSAGLLRLRLDGVLNISSLATERHLLASILLLPILLVLFRVQGLYDFDHILAGTREYARIANATTYGVFVALAASYFGGGELAVSRSWLLLAWGLSIGCVGAGRFAARRVVRRLRRRGALRRRVVIVGASTFGIAIAEQLRKSTDEGLDVVGFLDEYVPLGQPLLDEIAVVGRPGDLPHGLALDLADEYILIPQALPYERLEEITRLMVSNDRPIVRMAVSSSDLLTNGVLVAERGSVPLVTLRRARITGLEAVFKRGLDLFGAALALVLLAPFGNRSLLRRQQIYGAGGEPVTLPLFEHHVSTWLPLRGAPALLAVLRGQLSLVGPRPVTCEDGEPAPQALWLTAVKPGITGPWRLKGPGASLADQALQDLTYVRNYTIWEDARILWESIWRLRRESGAMLLGRWQEWSASPSVAVPGSAGLSESTACSDSVDDIC